jgi:hypothetical protein
MVRLGAACRARRRAQERVAHHGEQIVDVERHGHHGRRAEARHLVPGTREIGGLGRDDDDRDRPGGGLRVQALQQRPAGLLAQRQIEEHRGGPGQRDPGEDHRGEGGGGDAIAALLQHRAQQVEEEGVAGEGVEVPGARRGVRPGGHEGQVGQHGGRRAGLHRVLLRRIPRRRGPGTIRTVPAPGTSGGERGTRSGDNSGAQA